MVKPFEAFVTVMSFNNYMEPPKNDSFGHEREPSEDSCDDDDDDDEEEESEEEEEEDNSRSEGLAAVVEVAAPAQPPAPVIEASVLEAPAVEALVEAGGGATYTLE